MLPTKILQEGTTHDIQMFATANTLKDRAIKKARGENITDTYTPEQLEDMYSKFKESR